MPARYNIAKLVGKLHRKSPVRLWLESHEEMAESSASALFDALAHTDPDGWRDRAVAFHAMGLINLCSLEREQAGRLLLDAFNKPDVGGLTSGRFGRALFLSALGWLALALLISLPYGTTIPLGDLPILFLLGLMTAPFPLAFQEQKRIRITKRIAATALAQVGGPECIVSLLAHVQRKSPICDEAVAALKAILPSVTADWYGQLPAGCNNALVNMARSSYKEDLALAALEALEQAGDGICANAIARIIARITARSVAAPVYERAVAILPTLLARRAREQAAATLLRPSEKASTEHLVLPVYSIEPNVTNLLRAAHAEDQDTSIPHSDL